VEHPGGPSWKSVVLSPTDFKDADGSALTGWEGIKELRLMAHDRLRSQQKGKTRKVGKPWNGAPPQFRHLRWAPRDYTWTPDHLQIGVRWQPFPGRPNNNAYDATRPIIAEDSSYAQFWVSWNAAEPTESSTNYAEHMSTYLKTIETAVDVCRAEGLKVEFVFWHCPAWASVSGKAGGWKPKPDAFRHFVTRIAQHFKGRVHAYQLSHEINLKGYMRDGDIQTVISELFTKGARAIRDVYGDEPVIVSTSGCSPCQGCEAMEGLGGSGAEAVYNYYDVLIDATNLMPLVDALNQNVTDHFDGFGGMDGAIIPSTWGNYDLVRNKLDTSPFPGKKIMAAESWVVWDDAGSAI
ncbi:MAG: hypothetical protein AAF492_32300, partial [Verrucomicrobiota bacterium]